MGSNPGNYDAWTSLQNKAFEQALAQFIDPTEPWSSEDHHHPLLHDTTTTTIPSSPVASSLPWTKIASMVPGKSLPQIKHHYDLLLHDIASIETDRIPPPDYASFPTNPRHQQLHTLAAAPIHRSAHDHHHRYPPPSPGMIGVNPTEWPQYSPGHVQQRSVTVAKPAIAAGSTGHGRGSKANNPEQERKKGIPWTEEEHRLFLLGLDKFGKGDWRSISRNFVVSRTPTQVASHAQKYFIRLNSINKEKRRSSIHDITSPTTPTINDHLTPLSPSMTIPSPPRLSMPSHSASSSHTLTSQLVNTSPCPTQTIVNGPIPRSNTPSLFIPSPSDMLPFSPHSTSLVHQHNL